MATAAYIAQRAFRENNLLPTGKSPTASQLSEAVAVLSTLIESTIGTEIARELMNWPSPNFKTAPVNARYPLYPQAQGIPRDQWNYPPPNTRLVTRLNANERVYFQQNPPDGAMMTLLNLGPTFDVYSLTLDGNGYLIEGGPELVLNTAQAYTGTPIRWMFRADLGSWIRIPLPLAEDTELPFPVEFDDFWTAALCIRLSPSYGKPVSDITAGVASNGIEMLRARYYQDTPDANLQNPFVFNSYTSWGNVGGYGEGWYGV